MNRGLIFSTSNDYKPFETGCTIALGVDIGLYIKAISDISLSDTAHNTCLNRS
ncbi:MULTISPECIES: hypothetical protein [Arthrospira]|uniref:hypothetical protein n=1 Tax=Oscillatoriales TaxID=1150 RepID=UPI0002F56328|nr:hypothetical protein [Arthrospira platensis]MBD2669601.1 hypothetical protein [Arthrospira platensis FACHB-439]MDF2208356.1 hypothetical protein [Arthrospira platensis NCB002]MDT9182788.1 hypothetical protein [Limnospira sp. PMC 289.06]MDT9294914.1 hypothetical protein [Arthrospira platensis PCC 7345]MDT9310439.1 hypothetical protein [Limnospira sp. Paracas R14]